MTMVHGKNLFPLELILSGAQGYHIDRDGQIWSERARKGSLLKLQGSENPTGRYVSLSTNGKFGTNYKVGELWTKARSHHAWAAHTTPVAEAIGAAPVATVPKVSLAQAIGVKPAAPPVVEPVVRHHATGAAHGISIRGWLIGHVTRDDNIAFSIAPKIHTVEKSVDDELVRLAKQQPETTYVKVKITGAVVVPKVGPKYL